MSPIDELTFCCRGKRKSDSKVTNVDNLSLVILSKLITYESVSSNFRVLIDFKFAWCCNSDLFVCAVAVMVQLMY